MLLRAMVSNSTFDDVLATLTKEDLDRVWRTKFSCVDHKGISVLASGTVDRLLELAKMTGATIEKSYTSRLSGPDHLAIECYDSFEDYLFETFKGQVVFWSNDFNEGL